jgi:hypothetical protein
LLWSAKRAVDLQRLESVLLKLVDLILHQGDQGRDDDGGSLQMESW